MSEQPFPPVPVSPRHDGWTPEKQWRFVEALAATASITQAARMVGMNVRSAQRCGATRWRGISAPFDPL
jgi:hypothetical protein